MVHQLPFKTETLKSISKHDVIIQYVVVDGRVLSLVLQISVLVKGAMNSMCEMCRECMHTFHLAC